MPDRTVTAQYLYQNILDFGAKGRIPTTTPPPLSFFLPLGSR